MGSQTIAENTISNGVTTLNWILSDQVNSTTVTANADGTWNSAILYSAFGEIRSASGNTPTQYRFTSQLAQPELGLDWYASRFYDPYLNNFIQADSEAPQLGQSQTLNRYMYADQNPIRYNDPTGHDVGCSAADPSCAASNGLTFAAKWDMAASTIPARVEKAYADAGKLNPVTKLLLSKNSPVAGALYTSWASDELTQSNGKGGAAVSSAALDLAIISSTNLSNGLMILAVGGDIESGLGNGNVYTVAYETKLPEDSYPGVSRSTHFYLANKSLLSDMESDPEFEKGMNELIPNLSEQISKGNGKYSSPNGWTWHHDPYIPGLMQLVPSIQHTSQLLRSLFLDEYGNGGYANWGK